eukprot:snap_masked-scaffold252_size238019-processed-gene-1.16 protein:Tk06198 transcript:snap_masked-scaffold252_size238019-processed-gene-1.16-mRNA-1 annotation:"vitamin d3 receptor b-like"
MAESRPGGSGDLPEDEDGPKRSRICAVCQGPTETFHLNYGASTCFSCRAFFRRAIDRSRNPDFVCKKNGQCPITCQNRKSCRRCRYELCLKAGMKTGFVLDDTQKKVRFRKLIKRLKREKKTTGQKSRKAMDKEPVLPIKFLKKRPVKRDTPAPLTPLTPLPNLNESLDDLFLDLPLKCNDDPLDILDQLEPSIALLMEESDLSSEIEAINASVTCPTQDKACSSRPEPRGAYNTIQSPVEGPSPAKEVHLHLRSDVFEIQGSTAQLETARDQRVHGQAHSDLLSQAATLPESVHYQNVSGYPTPRFQEIKPDLMHLHRQMNWRSAVGQHLDPVFAQAMIGFHASYQGLSKDHLRYHLVSLADCFKGFARQSKTFNSLTSHDQNALVKRNTPIFASLILAKYFGPSLSGSDQLQWLFLGDTTYLRDYIQPMSFNYINSLLRLMIDPRTVHLYYSYIHYISQTFSLNPCWMGPLAHVLLFNTDPKVTPYLHNGPFIQGHFNEVVQKYCDNEAINTDGFAQLLTLLDKVTIIFVSNVYWGERTSTDHTDSGNQCVRYHEPSAITTTVDEKLWIKRECTIVDVALKSVPFGEETLKECIMFNLDVPVSKNFMNKITQTWITRFTNLFKGNDEFHLLSGEQQSLVLKKSVLPAFSVALCHSENMKTPDAQLEFGCGHQDMHSFIEGYKNMLAPGRKWRVMCLKDLNDKAKLYEESFVSDYMSLVRNMSDFIMDSTVVRLLLLYVLYSSAAELFPGHPISKVSAKYLTSLRKHFKFHTKLGEERLDRGLGEIKVLSGMIKTISCP